LLHGSQHCVGVHCLLPKLESYTSALIYFGIDKFIVSSYERSKLYIFS
jgi:hypothetical protein